MESIYRFQTFHKKMIKNYKLQVSRINSTSFSWRLLIESLSHTLPFANSFISLCDANKIL